MKFYHLYLASKTIKYINIFQPLLTTYICIIELNNILHNESDRVTRNIMKLHLLSFCIQNY